MNDFLDKAFSAHAVVKDKLRRSILGQESLDASTLRRDDVCAVGQWIYGEGARKHRGNALFEHFKTVHTAFHQEAYDAMMVSSAGDREAALEAIEHGGFQKQSAEIGHCIARMKKDPEFA
jgi:methyl-accepting chemotaxis protein